MSRSIESLYERFGHETSKDIDASTFSELVEHFEKERKAGTPNKKLSDNTLMSNHIMLGVLKKYLGDAAPEELNTYVIEMVLVALKEDRNLNDTSVYHYFSLLKTLLDYGVSKGKLISNPCRDMSDPPIRKRTKNPRKALDLSELKRLCTELVSYIEICTKEILEKEMRYESLSVERKTHGRVFMCGLSKLSSAYMQLLITGTGVRLSEATALRLSCLDLENNCFKVASSMTYLSTFKLPKNDLERTVHFCSNLSKHLQRWIILLTALLKRIGIEMTDDSLLFCNGKGEPLAQRLHQRWWTEWRREHGFNDLMTHELRHTQSTILESENLDLETIMNRLGWLDWNMLSNYVHPVDDKDKEAADIFDSVIPG